MGVTITVTTDTGYRAELHVSATIDGYYVVRTRAALGRMWSPFIDLKRFVGGARGRAAAERYALGLKAALESDGETPREEVLS